MILFKERPLRVSIQRSMFIVNCNYIKLGCRFHIVNLERERRMPRGDQSGNKQNLFSERGVVLFASHPVSYCTDCTRSGDHSYCFIFICPHRMRGDFPSHSSSLHALLCLNQKRAEACSLTTEETTSNRADRRKGRKPSNTAPRPTPKMWEEIINSSADIQNDRPGL